MAASIPGRATARPQQSGQAAAPSHSGSRTGVTAAGSSMPAGCCLTDVPELMRVRLLPLARLLSFRMHLQVGVLICVQLWLR